MTSTPLPQGDDRGIDRSPVKARDAVSARDALLFSLGEAVITEISTNELLRRVVDVLKESMAADRGTIYVYDEQREELRSVAAHLPEIPTIRVPIGQGVAGFVARTRQLVNVDQANADTRFWKQVDKRTGYKTECMIAAPVEHRDGTLLGVVQLLNKRVGTFTTEDEDTLRLLADQLAQLLEQSTVTTGFKRSDLPELTITGKEPTDEPAPQVNLEGGFNRIVGEGVQMQHVFRAVRRVAPTKTTVLITGESGTGKGRIARALHHNSKREQGAFVPVDCASLPDSLVESELFGVERRGADGEQQIKKGKVEQADGGTLLLDEIGDMPLATQGKLLGLLQDGTFTRVGGTDAVSSDIRILATTNRHLPQLVDDDRFRKDLYYRLRVVQIEVPALRKRGIRDLRLLVDHFLANASRRHRRQPPRIHPEAMRVLVNYPWPGNVRELQNCLESAVILADDVIYAHALPLPRGVENTPTGQPAGALEELFAQHPSLGELEARYLSYLLSQFKGNRSTIARMLGIGRNTLLRRIRRHGLE